MNDDDRPSQTKASAPTSDDDSTTPYPFSASEPPNSMKELHYRLLEEVLTSDEKNSYSDDANRS